MNHSKYYDEVRVNKMEITAIYKSAVGLDVHQKHVTACVIVERADGTIHTETKEFG